MGDVPPYLQYAAMLAVVAAALGYLWQSFRSGSDKLDDRLITNQKTLIEQLERQVEELTRQVNEFQGAMDQLKNENAHLRALVMGETVPAALQGALTGIANRVTERIDTLEDNLAAAVAAMRKGSP